MGGRCYAMPAVGYPQLVQVCCRPTSLHLSARPPRSCLCHACKLTICISRFALRSWRVRIRPSSAITCSHNRQQINGCVSCRRLVFKLTLNHSVLYWSIFWSYPGLFVAVVRSLRPQCGLLAGEHYFSQMLLVFADHAHCCATHSQSGVITGACGWNFVLAHCRPIVG